MYRPDGLDAVSEDDHDRVFGATFALYSDQELSEFVLPLEERLVLNGLDAHALFGGKDVLDAGCGGGRGSLLMARFGASTITAVDVSEQNVSSTREALRRASFGKVEVTQRSLERLPYPDGSFDFVWCNGVLMHTAVPSSTLAEVIRVIKPGGHAWIYVYGCGGIYWRFMATFRRTFAQTPPETLIGALQRAGIPTGRIAEMLDDWKAPYLRTYDDAVFTRALEQLGCDVTRLMRGMPYDTSEQLAMGAAREFVGEGDLRYLVYRRPGQSGVIDSATRGQLDQSHLVEATWTHVTSDLALERQLAESLSTFESEFNAAPELGIVKAARAQIVLRDEFLPAPNAHTLAKVVEVMNQS